MPGFGHGPFGQGPCGRTDWCFHVLYAQLPPRVKKQDESEGGLYKEYVKACSLPINRLRRLISDFDVAQRDPLRMRKDLLVFYAACFGLALDQAEAETFQRTEADIYGRFRLIKGTAQSFVVLARIHGFDATVQELWWNGSAYTATQPAVVDEYLTSFT